MKKSKNIFLIAIISILITISNTFALSIYQNIASHIQYNQYYLFNIEQNKLITSQKLNQVFDNCFPLPNSKIALTQDNKIIISDNIIIKPEAEITLEEPVKEIIPISQNQEKIYLVAITKYSIKYLEYTQNKLKIITQKPLISYNDYKKYDNKIVIANNRTISIFTISNLLWITNLNEKRINFKDVIYSMDLGNSKYVTLRYISPSKRIVTFYTKNNLEIKSIELQGNYRKIFLDFEEKEAILFDQSNSLKILSPNGELRESNQLPFTIIDIQKYNDGFVIITQNDEKIEFSTLPKNFNKI